ncbi:MAG: ankyrin repeat domain-containing protein [Alphaproteobacteria bacterium]|nr:ankyrin repeat domain-containing protein [Alphaproteobacteria bacterium]
MDKQEQLVKAAYAGNVERVKALLNEGVNPNSADDIEQTALFFAARSGHTEVVKALLTAGAEVDKPAGRKKRTALFMAAINGHYETAKALIDAGGDINKLDGDGITPLHYVVSRGRDTGLPVFAETVKKFIDEFNPDVNVPTTVFGKTPLHMALSHGQIHAVKVLLENGANPNAATKDGQTPLYYAASYSLLSSAKALLSAGADVNAADVYGGTPLSTAAMHDDVRMVKILADAGADVNKQNIYGYTALHMAVIRKDVASVAVLLNAGADKNIKNKDGLTPMDIAKRARDRDWKNAKDRQKMMVLLDIIQPSASAQPRLIARHGDMNRANVPVHTKN